MSEDDYKTGYGCPPKHTQFVPGESGNRGRKKKRPEFQAETIARVRDETVTVNGVRMTMFEVSIRSVFNATVKGARTRDLKVLLELLEKYGAISKVDAAEGARIGADNVMQKMLKVFDRVVPDDPVDVKALRRLRTGEAAIVSKCPGCSPALRTLWHLPEHKALTDRHRRTELQKDFEALKNVAK